MPGGGARRRLGGRAGAGSGAALPGRARDFGNAPQRGPRPGPGPGGQPQPAGEGGARGRSPVLPRSGSRRGRGPPVSCGACAAGGRGPALCERCGAGAAGVGAAVLPGEKGGGSAPRAGGGERCLQRGAPRVREGTGVPRLRLGGGGGGGSPLCEGRAGVLQCGGTRFVREGRGAALSAVGSTLRGGRRGALCARGERSSVPCLRGV